MLVHENGPRKAKMRVITLESVSKQDSMFPLDKAFSCSGLQSLELIVLIFWYNILGTQKRLLQCSYVCSRSKLDTLRQRKKQQ